MANSTSCNTRAIDRRYVAVVRVCLHLCRTHTTSSGQSIGRLFPSCEKKREKKNETLFACLILEFRDDMRTLSLSLSLSRMRTHFSVSQSVRPSVSRSDEKKSPLTASHDSRTPVFSSRDRVALYRSLKCAHVLSRRIHINHLSFANDSATLQLDRFQ